LEANLLQNTRILESWKLLTKYKLQYFPKILGAEKTYKRTQASRRKGGAS